MKLSKLILIFYVAMGIPVGVHGTNGMNLEEYGPIATGMGTEYTETSFLAGLFPGDHSLLNERVSGKSYINTIFGGTKNAKFRNC